MTGTVSKLLPALISRPPREPGPDSGQGTDVALKPVLSPVDREFLPAALEIVETPPSPVRIAMLWFTCFAFTALLAWSYFGEIDIHAVAQGRIQPSGRSKTVQTLEPGRVVTILAENGKRVEPGDVLLELDPTETGADREALARELDALDAEIARRRLAIEIAQSDAPELRPLVFRDTINVFTRNREIAVLSAEIGQLNATQGAVRSQLAERSASRQRLTMSIEARERLIKVLKERVTMRDILNEKKIGSRATVIDALQEFEKESTAIAGDKGQLLEIDAGLATLKKKLVEIAVGFVAEQSPKLAEAERKRDRGEQELIKARTRNERTQIKSPVNGTVQQLAVTTIGQVVSAGQTLMIVVPADAKLEVEVMVLNQDIGFVEAGQAAVVKVEAFPFTRYGTIDATVTQVSREGMDINDAAALSDPIAAQRGAPAPQQRGQNLVFPAMVRLDKRAMNVDGKDVPLSSGMMVTVEVKTGTRRVIDYVLSPLREVTNTAARGR